jgi:hypothetical protein
MQPAARKPQKPQKPPADAGSADLERARQPLQWSPDAGGLAYLDAHRPVAITTDAILDLLRVDRALIALPKVPPPMHQAVASIAMPEWARWIDLPEPEPIAQLPPDPHLIALARRTIEAGADVVVPWASAQKPVHARVPHKPPQPRKRSAETRTEPPPPPRRAKKRNQPPPPDKHVGPHKQPAPQPEPSARDERSWGPHRLVESAYEANEVAAQTEVTTATRFGLIGCTGKLIGLCCVLLVAWIGADAAMKAWADHVEELAEELRGRQLLPHAGLDWLVSLGPKDAPVTAVLACDPTGLACRPALGDLIAWLEADHDGPARRLVVLPVNGEGGDDDAVYGLYALLLQGPAADILRKVAAESKPLDLGRVRWLAGEVGADTRRWERDRNDEDVQQWQRLQALTARGLGLLTDPGEQMAVAVAGVPIGSKDIERNGRLEPAMLAIEQKLVMTAAVMRGDLHKAQAAITADRPVRERQRWQAWIVEGRRLGNGGK